MLNRRADRWRLGQAYRLAHPSPTGNAPDAPSCPPAASVAPVLVPAPPEGGEPPPEPPPSLLDADGHPVAAGGDGRWYHLGLPRPDCPVIFAWRQLADEVDLDLRRRWPERRDQLPREAEGP